MTIREHYNQQIVDFFLRKSIEYKFISFKYSDYYYILNIEGQGKHTLKIRVSNHPPIRQYEIPFLCFWYSNKNFPSKRFVSSSIATYIAQYKKKNLIF